MSDTYESPKTYADQIAFPSGGNSGMTKREHFAAQALGVIAASSVSYRSVHDAARDAVEAADALILALNKR